MSRPNKHLQQTAGLWSARRSTGRFSCYPAAAETLDVRRRNHQRLRMMTRVLAYAKDPLPRWPFTRRLTVVLRQLDDPTPPADILVTYRPSFGRGFAQPARTLEALR